MAPMLLCVYKTHVVSPARRLFIIGTLGAALLSVHVQPANTTQDFPSSQTKINAEEKPYGGTLTIGMDVQPAIINPVLSRQGISVVASTLVFNRLVRITPDGKLEPDLAQSWEISPDSLVYTFYLRKGVKFHDGVEFTADDALFTLEQIRSTRILSPFAESLRYIKNMEVVNPYTFRVTLTEPHATFIYELIQEIMPKHIYQVGDIRNSPFNYHPVGMGPFKFKEWTEKDEIILEANENYFEGRPYLDRVVFKPYANRREVWSAFMSGEVDLTMFLEVEDFEVTKKDPSFMTYEHTAPYYYAALYNLNDPVLKDRRVRIAIARSVNIKEMIERVEQGYGTPCTGPLSPDVKEFNPDVELFEYDPERAMELLQESGWQDLDGDSILEKEGIKLVIRMAVDSRRNKMSMIAALFRQELQKVGIRLEIHSYSSEKQLTPQFLRQARVQAHLLLLSGGGLDPGIIEKFWHSTSKGREILWPIPNVLVDGLFQQAQLEQDEDVRRVIYRRIHEIIYQEQPACFLYYEKGLHAASVAVGGAELFLNAHMPTHVIKDFYIRDSGDTYARRR